MNEQQNEVDKKSLVRHQDLVSENLITASAIIDCVRVLAALERMPSPQDSLENGSGFANGSRLRDESMPQALYHAIRLIEDARNTSEVIYGLAFKTCAQS